MNNTLIDSTFSVDRSIVQKIKLPIFSARQIDFYIKRDDLIDEYVSGNKWRKLKYNVQAAFNNKKDTLLTFGGAFSNHLLATAVASKKVGLQSIGIVRGEELNPESNDLLKMCNAHGMQLKFISREEYNFRNEKEFHEELLLKYPGSFIIPEGGANYYGIIGCQEILKETANNFDHVFVAQGTTTTSLGLAFSMNEESLLHVVPVLKGFDSINEMENLLKYSGFDQEFVEDCMKRVVSHSETHFGGYGKYTLDLLNKMEEFHQSTSIPLDPIYTGKVIVEILTWIEKENIQNCSVIFVHTGGIFGGKSIAKKEGKDFF